MSEAAVQAAPTGPRPGKQISPLSCLPLLAAVVVFTMLIAWLVGWWSVSSNEHLLQKNMLDIARAASEFRDSFGAYPSDFEQLSEYSIMLSPPQNPYTGEPSRFITAGMQPLPGDISLHIVRMHGATEDFVIVGYGLRPVPEKRRSDWCVLPGGVDPDRVLSAISVNSLPAEMLVREVDENTAAEQAAERWKLPEDK